MAEGYGINDFLILVVTMLANFVLEFLFCKLVVYRGKEDTLNKKIMDGIASAVPIFVLKAR